MVVYIKSTTAAYSRPNALEHNHVSMPDAVLNADLTLINENRPEHVHPCPDIRYEVIVASHHR